MTDEEAEAVLLTLGTVLAWGAAPPDYYHPNGSYAAYTPGGDRNRTSALYRVVAVARRRLRNGKLRTVRCYTVAGGGPSHDFPSNWCFAELAEAQAACERHYATGKWD